MGINFSGNWIADLWLCKLHGPLPAALTARIEHSNQLLREEVVVVTTEGGERRSILQCHIGGQQRSATLDGVPVQADARWEGEELVIELWFDAGNRALHVCDYWSLSPSGEVLTMEHRSDDLAGQKTVLRRAK